MQTATVFGLMLIATVAGAQIGPEVEVKGKITKVQASWGQGMPYIEVDTGDETKTVQLGSFRYLVQHNFNPRVGESVKAVGFARETGELVAKSVFLEDQNKRLQLRRDDGTPLWQRGQYGRRNRGAGRGRGGGNRE